MRKAIIVAAAFAAGLGTGSVHATGAGSAPSQLDQWVLARAAERFDIPLRGSYEPGDSIPFVTRVDLESPSTMLDARRHNMKRAIGRQ